MPDNLCLPIEGIAVDMAVHLIGSRLLIDGVGG